LYIENIIFKTRVIKLINYVIILYAYDIIVEKKKIEISQYISQLFTTNFNLFISQLFAVFDYFEIVFISQCINIPTRDCVWQKNNVKRSNVHHHVKYNDLRPYAEKHVSVRYDDRIRFWVCFWNTLTLYTAETVENRFSTKINK